MPLQDVQIHVPESYISNREEGKGGGEKGEGKGGGEKDKGKGEGEGGGKGIIERVISNLLCSTGSGPAGECPP